MDTVTVSTKFQVVIPRRVRERMRLRPGEKWQVISFDDPIELIPVRPMSKMRGNPQGLRPFVHAGKRGQGMNCVALQGVKEPEG